MGHKGQRIDSEGPAATLLGKVCGASGAVLLILADGVRAKEWPGYEGEHDGRNRTVLQEYEDVEAGLQCFAGGAGTAKVWQFADGVAFSEFYPNGASQPGETCF